MVHTRNLNDTLLPENDLYYPTRSRTLWEKVMMHSPTHLLTHPLTNPLTHSLPHSLTYSLADLPTHAPTHCILRSTFSDSSQTKPMNDS